MLTLYRRNRVYWLSRCEAGRQVRTSLRTRDTQTARALLRQAELDLLSGGVLKRVLWPEFQEEFLAAVESTIAPSTLRGYRITARRFGRFLKDKRNEALSDINPQTLSSFLEERRTDIHPSRKTTPQPGGIKFDLRCLHRIFAYALECGYMTTNPVRAKNLNSVHGRTMPFSPEEVAGMLSDGKLQADRRLKAVVLTFLYTGMRISDVIGLQKMNIVANSLIRQTIKRKRVISMRLHPKLIAVIEEYLKSQNPKQRAVAPLFCTPDGNPLKNNLNRSLRSLWKRCGIVGGHAHRFRDTFAVRLLSKGASLYDVAKLLGISAQTADRHYTPYVKELQERGAELVGKLDF